MGTWPKPQNKEEWTLRDVFERKEWDKEDGTRTTGQIHLRYEYDIGDGWGHTIFLLGLAEKGLHQVLAGREDNVPSSLCFGGQGHPCAEDCGGQFGWDGLKEAFKKQKGDRSKTSGIRPSTPLRIPTVWILTNGIYRRSTMGPRMWRCKHVMGRVDRDRQVDRIIGTNVESTYMVGSCRFSSPTRCTYLPFFAHMHHVPLVKRRLLYGRSRSPPI